MSWLVNATTILGFHKRLAQEPQWGPVLVQYIEQMRNGFYPQGFVDAVCQSTTGWYPDLYVAYCFANVCAWIGAGLVLTAKVEVGEEPLPDRDVEGNNIILSNLPWPFEAEFTGAKSSQDNDDGTFSWSKPVEFGQVLYTGVEKAALIGPRGTPLEVGTTNADRTLRHILHGGLARWPYESEWIYLFVPTKELIRSVINRMESGLQDASMSTTIAKDNLTNWNPMIIRPPK